MTTKFTARIYQGTPRNLAMLAKKLQVGELVGVPSETVYGLAADALNPTACRKIFKAKGRPTTDPLIVHLHHIKQLAAIAQVNPTALALAKAFWPGALTLILRKQSCVPDIVTSGLDSVAVRIPQHPLFRKLLKIAAIPLAAPSANPFGYVSPTTAEHVRANLGNRIRYILDGGASKIGLESTIIDTRDEKAIRLLRPGSITSEQIESTLGITVKSVHSRATSGSQVAPGMLSQHYSPRAKVVLHSVLSLDATSQSPDEARLYFAQPTGKPRRHTFWLDSSGNPQRAAHNLFAQLRMLDKKGYSIIHAENAPDGPYTAAINDRLERAAAKT